MRGYGEECGNGHRCCTLCVENLRVGRGGHSVCPLCRGNWRFPQPSQSFVRRLAAMLDFNCTNNGCAFEGCVEDLRTHARLCKDRIVGCPIKLCKNTRCTAGKIVADHILGDHHVPELFAPALSFRVRVPQIGEDRPAVGYAFLWEQTTGIKYLVQVIFEPTDGVLAVIITRLQHSESASNNLYKVVIGNEPPQYLASTNIIEDYGLVEQPGVTKERMQTNGALLFYTSTINQVNKYLKTVERENFLPIEISLQNETANTIAEAKASPFEFTQPTSMSGAFREVVDGSANRGTVNNTNSSNSNTNNNNNEEPATTGVRRSRRRTRATPAATAAARLAEYEFVYDENNDEDLYQPVEPTHRRRLDLVGTYDYAPIDLNDFDLDD